MPLKICLYSFSLRSGGAERQMALLVRELDQRGLDVILLLEQTDNAWPHYLETLKNTGVEIVNAMDKRFLKNGMECVRKHSSFYEGMPASIFFKSGTLYAAGALAALKPDIVHSTLDPVNVRAGCAAILADIPVHLASFRNVDPATANFESVKFTLPIYKYILARDKMSMEANSHVGAEKYAHWLGIDSDLIAYNPNGIDPAIYMKTPVNARNIILRELGLPANAKIILTLSRFSPEKAPESMLNIFKSARVQTSNVYYLIAGAGMDTDGEMGRMVQQLALEDRLKLLGERQDIPRLLAAADVLLLPSRVEGFPNAIMEAMTASVPVVASNVGGIPDLLRDGLDGFLHGRDDLAGMARSIIKLLADADLAANMGKSARDRVCSEFTLKKLGDRTIRRYQELLEEANRTSGDQF